MSLLSGPDWYKGNRTFDCHCLPLANLLRLPPPRAERADLMTGMQFVDWAMFTVSGLNQKRGMRKLYKLPRSSVLMVQACWSLSDDDLEITLHSVRSRRSSSAWSLNRQCGPTWPVLGRDAAASGTGLAGSKVVLPFLFHGSCLCMWFLQGRAVTRGDGQDRWTPNTPKLAPQNPPLLYRKLRYLHSLQTVQSWLRFLPPTPAIICLKYLQSYRAESFLFYIFNCSVKLCEVGK